MNGLSDDQLSALAIDIARAAQTSDVDLATVTALHNIDRTSLPISIRLSASVNAALTQFAFHIAQVQPSLTDDQTIGIMRDFLYGFQMGHDFALAQGDITRR